MNYFDSIVSFVAQKALKISEESYKDAVKYKEECETKMLELQSFRDVNETLKTEVKQLYKKGMKILIY